jgi:cyclopropane-fatty-acyl-phospholipid synthase
MESHNLAKILNQELIRKKINTSFDISLNQELIFSFGSHSQTPRFSLHLKSKALSALRSLDELKIAEAYINGHFEIEGDVEEAFKLREILVSKNPFFYLWNVFVRSTFFGQVKSDRKWISAHYDHGDELYFSFMDKTRTYSQGIFEDDREELETAMIRKHQFAYDACGLKPGLKVLDIGGGWGSFCEYAGKKGVNLTSITI